ncbi:metallophosphoesterase [Geminocystis sp. GBBB08]|uniref:metallophosphoesterase family protein n=1 Tax=Geminocystis sp. GBBB08 TaxID=2604140 RepID=UPI0027E37F9F|nr:metallophosphoesterase [Geminocystis sp. GBBB08]MBL1210743.1 metallophosphoesterase [Geminocystis sp. GBBB08]
MFNLIKIKKITLRLCAFAREIYHHKKERLIRLILLGLVITVFIANLDKNLTKDKVIAKENFSLEIQQIIEQYKPVQPSRGDVRLLVISDLNSAYGSMEYEEEVHLAIKMIPFWQPDLVLCSGDMIAGQKSSLTSHQIRGMWKAFDSQIAQPIRNLNIPFGFTIGNHDASGAISKDKFTFEKERDLAVEYWQNPDHKTGIKFVDGRFFPFYYTFEEEGIFFLVWDGSTSRIPSDKLAWVEKSLSSKIAQEAKMRVIIGHLPLYAVAEGRNKAGEVLENPDKLRTLLENYNVHTYISGHQHAYYPAHKDNLQLLHTGALGSGARKLLNSAIAPRKTITIIDINFDEKNLTTYSTYNMANFQLINEEELPKFITGYNGTIYRRDINNKKRQF